MEAFDKGLEKVVTALAYLASAIIPCIFTMIVIDVSIRTIGITPPLFTSSIVEYGLLYVAMFSAPWLVRQKGHVAIEALVSVLPPGVQLTLAKFMYLICCVSALLFAYFALQLFIDAAERGQLYPRAVGGGKSALELACTSAPSQASDFAKRRTPTQELVALLLAALVGMLLLILRSAFVAQVGRPYSAHWFVGSLLLLTPLFWLLFDWPALLQSAPYLPIREARQIEGARAYVDWLTQPDSSWPMFWTILVYTWAHMGFYMLIILAGLQAIPKDLYEAARMDGTRPARIFGRITLPLLMPTLFVVLILSLIKGFQIFDEVFVLTGGGPGNATLMVVQHIYQLAFGGVRKFYDSAAASSLVMAGFILAFTLVQIALNRRQFSGTRS